MLPYIISYQHIVMSLPSSTARRSRYRTSWHVISPYTVSYKYMVHHIVFIVVGGKNVNVSIITSCHTIIYKIIPADRDAIIIVEHHSRRSWCPTSQRVIYTSYHTTISLHQPFFKNSRTRYVCFLFSWVFGEMNTMYLMSQTGMCQPDSKQQLDNLLQVRLLYRTSCKSIL